MKLLNARFGVHVMEPIKFACTFPMCIKSFAPVVSLVQGVVGETEQRAEHTCGISTS